MKERKDPSGVFYYWKGERPIDTNAPQLDGTGEIRMESADRASGYFTTRAETRPRLNARTAGVYWRADPEDMSILDGQDDRHRAGLIAERLKDRKSITSTRNLPLAGRSDHRMSVSTQSAPHTMTDSPP